VPYLTAWLSIIVACCFAIAELVKAREAVKSEQSLVEKVYSSAKFRKLDELGTTI
jgi:hypothetical protein